jgi:hypothetical protein
MKQFRLVRPSRFVLPLFCLAPHLLSAQQDRLQFNVPYLCSDGSTYVVHRCEKGPKFEFCYYQRDQNSERYNVRSHSNKMIVLVVAGLRHMRSAMTA